MRTGQHASLRLHASMVRKGLVNGASRYFAADRPFVVKAGLNRTETAVR